MDKVLIATDGSTHAAVATCLAADLASTHAADVLVLHVVEGPNEPMYPPSDKEVLAKRSVHAAEEILEARGVEHESRVLEGSAQQVILDVAERDDIDLIALGNRGRGAVHRFFLGSVSDKVMHNAPCSVLLGAAQDDARHIEEVPVRHVVVATDGSADARKAAALGADIAAAHGADVLVLYAIVPPTAPLVPPGTMPDWSGVLEEAAHDLLADTSRTFEERGVRVETEVAFGSPAGCILDAADRREADLVVLGRSGTDALARLLVGSVSSRIVHVARTSVLLGALAEQASSS